ncbi:MAG: sugar ABC transporter permease, partial [Roseibium sp.]|uniref:carbohydrate ABC transporter permease n=1 Tax=Roseibium sp. TaxID=1936156 RepID=UPI002605105E
MSVYKNLSIRQKQILWAWIFLAVPTLFYGVIRFYPTGNAFVISFQDWNLLGARTWTGLDNYTKLWNDPVFWKVFRNTFVYLLLGTPISLVISFIIAYHLDKTRFMHGFLRMLYFLPFMTSAVAMAWVWRWFYQPVPIGLFNNMLASIGIPQIEFLNSTTNALPSVLAPAVWAGLGFQIIIFMAGLRAIPVSYYEAARIDGVGWWTVLTRITLPLLKPTIVFIVVFSSIGFLRIFDHVFNMTTNNPGGPLNSTKPLVLMIY